MIQDHAGMPDMNEKNLETFQNVLVYWFSNRKTPTRTCSEAHSLLETLPQPARWRNLVTALCENFSCGSTFCFNAWFCRTFQKTQFFSNGRWFRICWNRVTTTHFDLLLSVSWSIHTQGDTEFLRLFLLSSISRSFFFCFLAPFGLWLLVT